MNQNNKNILRQISKIYPPQISQNNNQIMIYNPLQPWVQSHSSSSLIDLIEISSNSSPLFLNQSNDQIIMQNNYEIFLESETNQWMKTIKRSLVSEEQIVSHTIKVQQNYLNINAHGSINIWKSQQEENWQFDQFNPQSLKDVSKSQQPKVINTTIVSQKLVKQYRHGYSFAPIMMGNQTMYTLHQHQDWQRNTFKKILKTDLEGEEGQSSYYQCFLPSNINKLINIGNTICAYGGQNGFIIDKRSESIVCNFNNEESSSINCIKYNDNKNTFYVCRDKKLLQLDIRNLSLQQTYYVFQEQIDNIQLFQQKQKSYCGLSFKTNSQIAMIQI